MKRDQVISRILIFLLCAALLCAYGCRSAPQGNSVPAEEDVTAGQLEERLGMPVVSILVDTDLEPVPFDQLSMVLDGLPGHNRDFSVNIEKLPREGIARDTRSAKLRTEILAGKGPDLFLCGSNRLGLWGEDFSSKPFFQIPEQSIDNHIFLPLDDYIDNAEYMDWDSLLPRVMEAGRGEEGQMILPMGYYINLSFFDKTLYTPSITLPCSWDEVVDRGDPAVRCASNDGLRTLLGEIADCSTDTLLITEEDLFTRAKEELALRSIWQESESRAPEHFSGYLDRGRLPGEDRPFSLDDGSPEYHMIPHYNIYGGVTAQVSFYAAVNRNARRPDEAFKIADYLLSTSVQQNSPF